MSPACAHTPRWCPFAQHMLGRIPLLCVTPPWCANRGGRAARERYAPPLPLALTPNDLHTWQEVQNPTCYVFIGLWTYTISFCPISLYLDPLFPLSLADYIGLLLPFLLSLITSIVNCPLSYLVADPLSPYPCGCSYLVRYITSQSRGTVGLGLCPLRLSTLLARGCPAVYKMYH